MSYSEKSSDHFVIALLVVDNEKRVKNCLKRIKQRKIQKKYRDSSELKFYDSSPTIRKRVLRCLASNDIQIAYIVLEKDRSIAHDKPMNVQLYSLMTSYIVSKILEVPRSGTIRFFVDKSFSRKTRGEFNEYIKNTIINQLNVDVNIEISHENSQLNPSIQAVDFIAGAIFQFHEHDDLEYMKIIEQKINEKIEIKR